MRVTSLMLFGLPIILIAEAHSQNHADEILRESLCDTPTFVESSGTEDQVAFNLGVCMDELRRLRNELAEQNWSNEEPTEEAGQEPVENDLPSNENQSEG